MLAGWFAAPWSPGAVQTTPATTAAGMMIAIRKRAANMMWTTRERKAPARAPRRPSLVRKIFKFRGQLAYPSAVVQTADEARVTLIARDVQELLLRDQRAQPREVCVGVVAHDAADDAGELAPLAFREWFAVTGDGDQQRGGRTGDGLGQDFLGLGPRDDLFAGADDVGDPVATHADDVAAAADRRALEISRPCVHRQAHYSR